MDKRNDKLWSGSYYENGVDEERRVVRNPYGPLPDPESEPDWRIA